MKLSYQLPITIASIAIAASNISADQLVRETEGRQHNLTISLKTASAEERVKRPKPNDKGKYSWSQKIVTEKISNKQILEALAAEEEPLISSIKGWSIVMVTGNSGEIIGTFLEKKGEELINIDEYFSTSDDYSFDVSSGSGKVTEEPYLDAATFSVTMQFLSNLELNIGIYARVTGVLEATAKGSYEYDGDYYDEELFIKKGNFTDLTGLALDNEGDDDEDAYGIVTGNVKAGEGSKTTSIFYR